MVLVNVIIWFMSSFSVGPKVITLSGFHCFSNLFTLFTVGAASYDHGKCSHSVYAIIFSRSQSDQIKRRLLCFFNVYYFLLLLLLYMITVTVIIRFMLSFFRGPKVITLSGASCVLLMFT
jgi:hypothetical protein